MNNDIIFLKRVYGYRDDHLAFDREFERIADQVYQELAKTSLVANQAVGHIFGNQVCQFYIFLGCIQSE